MPLDRGFSFESDENALTKEYTLNLDQLFLKLIKHRNILFIFSFFSIILSSIFALNTKRVWEGEFQIVLDSKESSQISSFIESKLKLNPKAQQLSTEVEILKSPSVLMDIFNFVKTTKNNGEDIESSFSFKSWKKALAVEF